MAGWLARKPSLSFGQLPCLVWDGEVICQSMAICRFLAKQMNIAGRNNLEIAQVDEIVDVIQDVIRDNVRFTVIATKFFIYFVFQYSAWYASNREEELKKFTEIKVPLALVKISFIKHDLSTIFWFVNFSLNWRKS